MPMKFSVTGADISIILGWVGLRPFTELSFISIYQARQNVIWYWVGIISEGTVRLVLSRNIFAIALYALLWFNGKFLSQFLEFDNF